jgi:hypothetical protein
LLEAGPTLKSPAWLAFQGPLAFAWDGVLLPELPRLTDYVVPTGVLEEVGPLDVAPAAALARLANPQTLRHSFQFVNGALVEGRLVRERLREDGRRVGVELEGARLTLPGRAPLELPSYFLLAAGSYGSAEAGAVDGRFHGETEFSRVSVPRPRRYPARELELIALYQRASDAHSAGRSALLREFPRIAATLERSYTDEWLLRWNLLESLLKAGDTGSLGERLCVELAELEDKFERRQPIASGLRYLAKLAA